MFDAGRRLLAASGKSAVDAGRLLGKWRKDHGTEAVISAISLAQREGAIEPVSYIEGCLRFQSKAKPKWTEGALRTLSPQKVQVFWDGHWENTNDYTADEAERHPRFVGRAPAYANA